MTDQEPLADQEPETPEPILPPRHAFNLEFRRVEEFPSHEKAREAIESRRFVWAQADEEIDVNSPWEDKQRFCSATALASIAPRGN